MPHSQDIPSFKPPLALQAWTSLSGTAAERAVHVVGGLCGDIFRCVVIFCDIGFFLGRRIAETAREAAGPEGTVRETRSHSHRCRC